MPARSKHHKSGGLMGRVAKRALKEAVGGRSSRSRYDSRYGPRPSHRLAYDSYESDDYSFGGYGAPLMPYSRHSKRPSGGPLLSGPFGDQLKWKIGDYIVRKFANPKSLIALIPGFKSDDSEVSSSDTSSLDSEHEDSKRSRRKPQRKSSRKHDMSDDQDRRRMRRRSDHGRKSRDDSSLDSSEDEKPRPRRRHQRDHHRSRRHHGDRETNSGHRNHRKEPIRRHDYRSRRSTRPHGRQDTTPPHAADYGVPYGAPTPYY